jgi:hypothetical protein
VIPVQRPVSRSARSLFLFFLCLWLTFLVFWLNHTIRAQQARNYRPAPFGVFTFPDGQASTQDFSYNMLYLQGIQHRQLGRPYRMEDQEKYMRRLLPECPTGMTHAYSPVALVLAQPLLELSGQNRYLVYTALCATGLILLYHYVLLPRVKTGGQLAALAIGGTSICLILNFDLGQSAMFTVTLLGAFWALLRHRDRFSPLLIDVAIALLFWGLCLKPNVAIVPAMLLLGARAWRPLLVAACFLLLTWTMVAGHYGGWWTGLGDYSHLLNHYDGPEMTPFMQRPSATTGNPHPYGPFTEIQFFSLERTLLLVLSGAFLLLRWTRRLTASEHFQAMVGAFLLASPYLLPSEDLVLLLLVVEGPFFRSGPILARLGKILIFFGILDLRSGFILGIDPNYALRLALFAWMLVEAVQARRGTAEPAGSLRNSWAST